jgi:hypothetical protein
LFATALRVPSLVFVFVFFGFFVVCFVVVSSFFFSVSSQEVRGIRRVALPVEPLGRVT